MRKGCLPVVFVAFFLSIRTFSQQREVLPIRLEPISPVLYQVLEGRGARGGVCIGDDAVLVIDSKMDEVSVTAVLEEIKKITDKPVRFLVNTHSDGDHVNGNQYFPASVLVIAHENCRKEMLLPKRDGAPSDWTSPDLAPYLPSITFSDRMDIHLGLKDVQLWYFGKGHTTGDVVVYFPDEKTAFVGDQVFSGRPQLIHSYKGGNSFEHVKTLERMLETLDAEKFCSGHCDILDRAAVRSHIEEMKSLQGTVRAMKNQGKTADQIKAVFSSEKAALVETVFQECDGPGH